MSQTSSDRTETSHFVRKSIREMAGYVPGEQPRTGEALKLNTNENPYPPSPRVFEAIQSALTSDRLRKYPDATGSQFREVAAKVLDVDPDGIIVGNGSDDILTILTRTFVPEGGRIVSPTPSYILYRTMAGLQGARFSTVDYTEGWDLPTPWPVTDANLTLIANPNSPSGTVVTLERLGTLAHELRGPLVIDEAYADFASENALELLRAWDGPVPLIVTRTFSKSYSLAGIRFGFGITQPAVAREMAKVKDSYNCDVLSQVAATAAIEDQDYFVDVRGRILATRSRLQTELERLCFDVTRSEANFLWCRRDAPVKPIYEELKRRCILIRYMVYEGYGDGLRITVGTDAEVNRLIRELEVIL